MVKLDNLLCPRIFYLPEHNAFRKWIQTIHQFQLSITTQCDHLIHFLQVLIDRAEALHKHVKTLLAHVL